MSNLLNITNTFKKIGLCLLATGSLIPTLPANAEINQVTTTTISIYQETKVATTSQDSLLRRVIAKTSEYARNEWQVPNSAKIVRTSLKNCDEVMYFSCKSTKQKLWEITFQNQTNRWIFISTANASEIVLNHRDNLALNTKKIAPQVLESIRSVASQYGFHQSEILSPKQILISKVEPIIWKDTCLELANPGEKCPKKTVQGYRVTAEGKPGKNIVYRTDLLGNQVKPNISQAIVRPILQNANQEWGLSGQNIKISSAERIGWSKGCEGVSIPYACDPIPVSGWLVNIQNGMERWTYRMGDNSKQPELLARNNPYVSVSAAIPVFTKEIEDSVRQLAASHFEIKPSQALIVNSQRQVWRDGCLGLGSSFETCVKQRLQGWQVTIAGKRGQQQVYRVGSSGKTIRTQASNGLPSRSDALPNSIAKNVFKNASVRLKTPIENLHIAKAQKIQEKQCVRIPTDAPNAPCRGERLVDNGWHVEVRNSNQKLAYNLDLVGNVKGVNIARY